MTTYAHGEPTWQDHTSGDDAKAAAFYAALLGWQVPEGDPQMGGYRNCMLGGQVIIAPEAIESGTFVVAADNTGATFNVIQVKP